MSDIRRGGERLIPLAEVDEDAGSMSMVAARDAQDWNSLEANELLAGLPRHELDLLRERGQIVDLPAGRVLYERGERIGDVYFPIGGLTSLLAEAGSGLIGEVGLIGRDGLVGVPAVLLSDAAMPWVTLVQSGGPALRISARELRATIDEARELRERCFRYIEVLMFQVSQTAACNARHGLPERLARWLLMALDRIDGDTVPLTHEFLANMLGVRRAGVTVTANELQSGGLLRVARGRLTVTDRPGLERRCCACYGFVRKHEMEASRREAAEVV